MSHNTLLHRVVRPAVSALAASDVSPDLLTGLRLLTGLGAAACFAAGRGPDAVGGAVFVLSMLLDRADGALARQRRRFSRFGALFDLASDCVSTMAAFVGLGLGLGVGGAVPFATDAIGPRAAVLLGPLLGPLLGAVAAVAVAAVFVQTGPDRGDAAPDTRWFDPDDVMLVVPLAVWCGGAGWILLLAAVLAPVAAVVAAILRLRGRRGGAPGG